MPEIPEADTIQVSSPPPIAPSNRPQPPVTDEWDLPDSKFDPELDLPPEALLPSAAKPAVVPPSPPPAPPPAPVSKHSARLTRLATNLGMTQAEINGYSPDELLRETQAAQIEFAHVATINRNRESVEQFNRAPKPPEPPVEEPIDLGLGEDEAEFDPRLIGVMKNIVKQNRDLQKELKETQGRIVAREAETVYDHLDRRFSEKANIFGQGRRGEVQRQSREFKRRAAFVEILKGMQDKPGSLDQKFDFVYDALYGTDPAPTTEPPVEPAPEPEPPKPTPPRHPDTGRFTAQEWNDAALARPTQRRGSQEPKGPNRAVKAVAAKMRENGTLDEFGGGVEEQGLPD